MEVVWETNICHFFNVMFPGGSSRIHPGFIYQCFARRPKPQVYFSKGDGGNKAKRKGKLLEILLNLANLNLNGG